MSHKDPLFAGWKVLTGKGSTAGLRSKAVKTQPPAIETLGPGIGGELLEWEGSFPFA